MKLTITGALTDFNSYINQERTNRYAAANIKEKETLRVYWECKAQKLSSITEPVFFDFIWFCASKRKDKDNICAFARKVIFDGLVMAKVLQDDGWDNILGFSDTFILDRIHPRVEVTLYARKNTQKKATQVFRDLTRG